MKSFLQYIKFKSFSKHLYALCGMIVLAFLLNILSFSSDKSTDSYEKFFKENYHVFGMSLPKDLNFAGEKVPLNDFMIAESMDRELTSNVYFQSQTVMLIKRANRWFPIIEPILKRNGVPDDIKYIPLIESNLTNAVSPRGATGFWQFMEPSGKNYGLEITEEVDERYSVEKSTQAACDYFKDGYSKYNSWCMALAGYNYGFGAVAEQVKKQNTTNYFELLLPEETTRYVFRILALKEIVSNPKKYGFHIRKKDLYPPVKTQVVILDSSVTDFVSYARTFDLNYKTFKYFNPWLRQTYLTNTLKKKYQVLLPKGNYNEAYFYDMQHAEQNLSSDDSLKYFTRKDTGLEAKKVLNDTGK